MKIKHIHTSEGNGLLGTMVYVYNTEENVVHASFVKVHKDDRHGATKKDGIRLAKEKMERGDFYVISAADLRVVNTHCLLDSGMSIVNLVDITKVKYRVIEDYIRNDLMYIDACYERLSRLRKTLKFYRENIQ